MVMHRDDTRTERADQPEVVDRYAGTGVTATVVMLAIFAIAAVILLAQNTEQVSVEFLWLEGEVPLYVLFLVTSVATALVTAIASGVWRRRRRRMRNEHEELERLRQRVGS